MARDGNPKHSARSYDPTGEIAAALNAPLPPEREKIARPNVPADRPPPMFGLRPAPRYAKAPKRRRELPGNQRGGDGDEA